MRCSRRQCVDLAAQLAGLGWLLSACGVPLAPVTASATSPAAPAPVEVDRVATATSSTGRTLPTSGAIATAASTSARPPSALPPRVLRAPSAQITATHVADGKHFTTMVPAARASTQGRAQPVLVAAGPACPTVTVAPTGTSASLGPLEYIAQTYNNCGPASVAEVLRYWGIYRTQWQVQQMIRADGNPGGTSVYGIPVYAQSLGLHALMGVQGNEPLLKALLSNGFPVLVTQWVSLWDRYGHMRPIEAFSEYRGGFTSSDPYLGPGYFIGYAAFDDMWAARHRAFIVLYPPDRGALVQAVLAANGWNKTTAYQINLAAHELQRTDPTDYPPYPGFTQPYYTWLNVAWDQAQLGETSAAQASLEQARAAGASPILINWITQVAAGSV